jgi:hypothetical protein
VTISGQQLGEHVPVARQWILNNATVGYYNGNRVISLWSVLRCYKQGTKLAESSVEFCTGGCEDRA